MHNEQVVARELITEFDHPGIGRVRQPKPAAEFGGTPARSPSPAPAVGEHGAEILAELGYAREDIERLAGAKVVRLARVPKSRVPGGQGFRMLQEMPPSLPVFGGGGAVRSARLEGSSAPVAALRDSDLSVRVRRVATSPEDGGGKKPLHANYPCLPSGKD